jgi:hypothetical protein
MGTLVQPQLLKRRGTMSTEKLTKEQFEEAVARLGLTEQEPISGESRRHFGNASGAWGTVEGQGRFAERLLYAPSA